MANQTTLLELPPDLPDFSTAMNNLGRVPLAMWDCLERAASKTASFRDSECPNERLDEGLAATLVRFHAKRYLNISGIEAQLDQDWTLDWLPFLGLSFHHNGYHVRILKGSDGCLPGCGISEKKKNFYSQIPTMYLVGKNLGKQQRIFWRYGTLILHMGFPVSGSPCRRSGRLGRKRYPHFGVNQ